MMMMMKIRGNIYWLLPASNRCCCSAETQAFVCLNHLMQTKIFRRFWWNLEASHDPKTNLHIWWCVTLTGALCGDDVCLTCEQVESTPDRSDDSSDPDWSSSRSSIHSSSLADEHTETLSCQSSRSQTTHRPLYIIIIIIIRWVQIFVFSCFGEKSWSHDQGLHLLDWWIIVRNTPQLAWNALKFRLNKTNSIIY